MSDYTKIVAKVDAEAETIATYSKHVWELAEVSYQELKSSAYCQELLESRGFKISDRGIGGLATSWIATSGSGSPTIGIMVEYDALPGLGNDTVPKQTPAKSGITSGHGCGHNLIGSTSVGAAIALKNHMEAEGLQGTLQVYGCPAEEALNGKNYMAMDGAFDTADVILHNHPSYFNTVWNFHSAGSVDLIVEFQGVTAHAGFAPWDGRNAVHGAELLLHGCNLMREQMLPSARLHYQILDGGKAVNVVPDYAKVLVRYRGPSAENIKKHIEWIKDIAKGAALATQTTSTVTNLGGIHDCLPNDVLGMHMNVLVEKFFPIAWTDEDHKYAKAIQKECGKKETGMATDVKPFPKGVEIGGSSDVGTVSWKLPTMGVLYSAWPQGISPHQWGCTACVGMDIGTKASVAAAKVMASMGHDLLTNPQLLKDAQAEFKKHLEESPFVSLCDSNKNPAGALDLEHRHVYECCVHSAMKAFGLDDGLEH